MSVFFFLFIRNLICFFDLKFFFFLLFASFHLTSLDIDNSLSVWWKWKEKLEKNNKMGFRWNESCFFFTSSSIFMTYWFCFFFFVFTVCLAICQSMNLWCCKLFYEEINFDCYFLVDWGAERGWMGIVKLIVFIF